MLTTRDRAFVLPTAATFCRTNYLEDSMGRDFYWPAHKAVRPVAAQPANRCGLYISISGTGYLVRVSVLLPPSRRALRVRVSVLLPPTRRTLTAMKEIEDRGRGGGTVGKMAPLRGRGTAINPMDVVPQPSPDPTKILPAVNFDEPTEILQLPPPPPAPTSTEILPAAHFDKPDDVLPADDEKPDNSLPASPRPIL